MKIRIDKSNPFWYLDSMINKASPKNQLTQEYINAHFEQWLLTYCSGQNRENIKREIEEYLNYLSQSQFDYVFEGSGWEDIKGLAERWKKNQEWHKNKLDK